LHRNSCIVRYINSKFLKYIKTFFNFIEIKKSIIIENIRDISKNIRDISKNIRDISKNIKDIFLIIREIFLIMI
jgi:hypothetical protein